MSSKPKTVPDQHRALVAALADFVRQPMDNGLGAHPAETAEQALRLAGLVLALLTKHRTDKHGDCTRCQPPPKAGWRALLPHCGSRNPCLIWKFAHLFLGEEPAVAWWQALKLSGHHYELAEVRTRFTTLHTVP